MKLTFVTGNAGKLAEAQGLLLPLGIDVVGDARGYPEIQADSLAAVAEAGAHALLDAGMTPPFFLEDSGFHVQALGGFPAVYSSFVMKTIGPNGILQLMADHTDRIAWFEAVVAYVDANRRVHLYAGKCRGTVPREAAGTGGFGFDSIFTPDGFERTFAQMTSAEKTDLSHRGVAMRAFLDSLIESAKT